MNHTAAVLDRVVNDLDQLLRDDQLAGLPDADRLDALRVAGAALRRLEAVVVETVAAAETDFAAGAGCRNTNELLQRTLTVDAPAAGRIVRAARAVRREVNLVSGERMPAKWPALRGAMLDGALGVTGLLAAIAPFEQAGDRIRMDDRLLADAELARQARGEVLAVGDDAGGDGAVEGKTVDEDATQSDVSDEDADQHDANALPAPPATPEDLKQFATLMAMYLDPDGAEPSEAKAMQSRYLTIGRAKDGTHPVRGNLLPEIAAQLQLIIDAFNNPKVGGAPAPGVTFTTTDDHDETLPVDEFNDDPRNVIDPRTPAQKRHDALAAALSIAARHESMPTLAGAAPTLVVHVDVNDLARHTSGSAFGATEGGGRFGADDGHVNADGGACSNADGATTAADGATTAADGGDSLAGSTSGDCFDPDGGGCSSAGGAGTAPGGHVISAGAADRAADAPGSTGTGWATLPDGTPVSAAVAAHTGCTGTIQRVLYDEGRIIGITTTDRVFTIHQRRAIIARDRECLIPGCHVPATWCEIHHVTEHARGGPTTTDNGVPLCWHHHRTLDHSGWEIRMHNGHPEIRGPAWWDPTRTWRTPRPSIPTFTPTRT